MPGLADLKNTVVSKEKDGGGSPVFFLLKTLLIGYLFTGMLLCLLAFLAYKASLPEKTVALACTVIYILSCLLCGFLAGKSSKKRRFFFGMLAGGLYFAGIFALSVAFGQKISFVSSHTLITLTLCAGCGMLGGMVS